MAVSTGRARSTTRDSADRGRRRARPRPRPAAAGPVPALVRLGDGRPGDDRRHRADRLAAAARRLPVPDGRHGGQRRPDDRRQRHPGHLRVRRPGQLRRHPLQRPVLGEAHLDGDLDGVLRRPALRHRPGPGHAAAPLGCGSARSTGCC
ncbi:hypothetical protein ACFSTC_38590 [Nonomuraea ferruginea]